MVNDNWKSQGPSYQLPARDVGFRLLGRRFSANKQSVSIKIFDPAQILAGSQPVIYSSRSLDLLPEVAPKPGRIERCLAPTHGASIIEVSRFTGGTAPRCLMISNPKLTSRSPTFCLSTAWGIQRD